MMNKRENIIRTAVASVRTALLGLSIASLAACTGPGGIQPQAQKAAPKPVQLVKKPPKNEIKPLNAPSVLRAKNDAAITKAVENFRINKKKKSTENRSVATDLNGDGSIEVFALMSGKDWCTPAGCDLILFRNTERGLRPMQTVKRVKAPIVVSPIGLQGWRDLIVQTGGTEGTLGQKVRLRFSGSGYPKNAMTQPKVRIGIPSTGETVIPRYGDAPQPASVSPPGYPYSGPTPTGSASSPVINPAPQALIPQRSGFQSATAGRPAAIAASRSADPFRGPDRDTEPR